MKTASIGLAATLVLSACASAQPPVRPAQPGGDTPPVVAVAPQYDTTHVYVAPEYLDRFAQVFLATFGGRATKTAVVTVTPTPSRATWQVLDTPVGLVSLFGFTTPVPYPFGSERTGYLVTDLDVAVRSARECGAALVVDSFPDAIGRDAVIEWPGGVEMQLYWHVTRPSHAALESVPENRVYVSADRVGAFVDGFVRFSQGKIVSDETRAAGAEIGRPGETYRRLRLESAFGKMTVVVTDGHLPYPYGRETTGYEVRDLADTLAKAKAAGAIVLVEPSASDHRQSAMVELPGGYVAEVHSISP
jgi:hypothetical protein